MKNRTITSSEILAASADGVGSVVLPGRQTHGLRARALTGSASGLGNLGAVAASAETFTTITAPIITTVRID